MKNTRVDCVKSLFFVFFTVFATARSALPAEDRWMVRLGEKTAAVTGAAMKVNFRKSTAWTVSQISYRDQLLVQGRGSNGTVIAFPKFIGTGHGGEEVHRFFFRCDGDDYEPGDVSEFGGEEIKAIKESTIGPFKHRAEIIFPAEGDFILHRYQYRITEPLDDLNLMYAFMHCVHNDFKEYIALLPDSNVKEERLDDDDGSVTLQEDVKAVVYYSDAHELGMAFVFPEVYRGAHEYVAGQKEYISNFIWDRSYDNKLYFNSGVREKGLGVGDEFEYRLKLTPFAAAPDEWKEIGLELAADKDF